jgi:hypothetical protein
MPVTCGTIGADLAQRVEPESLPASALATSAWWRDGAGGLELLAAGMSPISQSTCSSQCSSQTRFYGTKNSHLPGAMRSPSGGPSTSVKIEPWPHEFVGRARRGEGFRVGALRHRQIPPTLIATKAL